MASNGPTSKFHFSPLKIVSVLAVTLGKGDFAGWINNSHVCLRYFSGLWKRTAEVGGAPQSLTPPLPQPSIRPRGSPHCGHFMPVCEVMTKLEPAMFYSQFRAHSARQWASRPSCSTHRGPEESAAFTHCRRLSEVFAVFICFLSRCLLVWVLAVNRLDLPPYTLYQNIGRLKGSKTKKSASGSSCDFFFFSPPRSLLPSLTFSCHI